MQQLVAESAFRIRRARAIADEARGHEPLHRLAMQTVFVLEDLHETLVRMATDEVLVVTPPTPEKT